MTVLAIATIVGGYRQGRTVSSITRSTGAPSQPSQPSPWLFRLDRNFRLFGKLTLAVLLATAGLIAADIEAWRGVFALAHLAALVALAPLGVGLIVRAFREEGSLGAVVRRYRFVAALLGVVLVTVVLSLANFEGGSRILRRTANLTTVAIALVLVWRYLGWARTHLSRR